MPSQNQFAEFISAARHSGSDKSSSLKNAKRLQKFIAERVSKAKLPKADRSAALKISNKFAQQSRAISMTSTEIARDAVFIAKAASKLRASSKPASETFARTLQEVANNYGATVFLNNTPLCMACKMTLALRFEDMLNIHIPLPDGHPLHKTVFVA